MADIFDVVADPTRRDLLQVLLDRYVSLDSESGEISVGEIVEKLGISQPTVSKHLKVLRDQGLVTVREEGQHRYYCIDTSPLEVLEDWLIPFLSADFDTSADVAGSAVFAAWSGMPLPEPGKAGNAVGRAAANAAFGASKRIQGAIEPLKSRFTAHDEK
jgi:DNA-binding transcriptional ArsR family regulator